MAGALSELIGHNLVSDFRHLDLTKARVVVVEMTDHLLPGVARPSQERALETLLAVHLVFLIGFRNRLVVMVNWAWNYLTWDRASRVILDDGSTTSGLAASASR